nr:hypothetical protein 13 [bacterium]
MPIYRKTDGCQGPDIPTPEERLWALEEEIWNDNEDLLDVLFGHNDENLNRELCDYLRDPNMKGRHEALLAKAVVLVQQVARKRLTKAPAEEVCP